MVTFANCPLLWVSNIKLDIGLSTLHSRYMALSRSVRVLLQLKILIKEVIDNLGIDSGKLKFVSSSTVYVDTNGAISVSTSPRMTTASKSIVVKYHWFRQHVGIDFVIQKIDSENQKTGILTKVYKVKFL